MRHRKSVVNRGRPSARTKEPDAPSPTIDDTQEYVNGTPVPDVVVYVNFRLLLISLGLAGVCLGIIYVVHDGQMSAKSDHFRQLADEAEAEGDLTAAIKHLATYLSFQRDDNDESDEDISRTLARLADLHLRRAANMRDRERAYQYLEEVLRLDPKNHVCRSQLVDVAMTLARYGDAITHISRLLDQSSESNAPAADAKIMTREELLLRKAQCYERSGDVRSAQIAYCERIVADDGDSEPYVQLATVIVDNPSFLASPDDIGKLDIEVSDAASAFIGGVFPPAAERSDSAAVTAAAGVIDLMIQHASREWNAQRLRAEFLTSIGPKLSGSRSDDRFAQVRAEELIAKWDKGDQDGVLRADEADRFQLPPLADRNGDGQIARSELVERLTTSDSATCMQQGEFSINRALELVEQEGSDEKLLTFRSAVDVLLNLAESVQYQDRQRLQQYLARAGEFAERASELDDGSPESLFAEAQLHLRSMVFESDSDARQQRLDAAQELLEVSREKLSKPPGTNPSSADDAQIRLQVAVTWSLADVLIYQLELHPDDAAAIRRQIGDPDRSENSRNTLLGELKQAGSPSQLTSFLIGRLRLVDRKWKLADAALRTAASDLRPDADLVRRSLLLRAQCALRLGNPEARFELTAALIRSEPTWAPAQIAHAEACVDVGRLDEAIERYAPYAAQPDLTERFVLLLLLRETRKPVNERRWTAVESALDLMEKQEQNRGQFVILKSELLFQQAIVAQVVHERQGSEGINADAKAKLQEAQEILDKAVADTPAVVDVLAARIEHYVRRFDLLAEDRVRKCQSALHDAMQQVGDDVALRRAAAMAASLQPKPEALASLIELVRDRQAGLSTGDESSHQADDESSGFTADERTSLLKSVAQAYMAIGERELAIQTYLEALKPPEKANPLESPNNEVIGTDITVPLGALQLLVDELIANSGDVGENQALWDNVLSALSEIEGGIGPHTSYYKAARIIFADQFDKSDTDEIERARKLLMSAERQRGHWAAVHRMLGELETRLENREAAVDELEEAFELGDFSESVVGRLWEHYERPGQDVESLQLSDDRVERLANRVALERPELLRSDLARCAWRTAHRLADKGIISTVLHEQARVFGSADDKIEAAFDYLIREETGEKVEDLLHDAVKAEPQSPRPRMALVKYYARSGKSEQAVDAIKAAEAELNDDSRRTKLLTLARCYEMLRTTDEQQQQEYWDAAERQYLAVVEAAPDDDPSAELYLIDFYTRVNRLEQAQSAIEKLLDPSRNLPPEVQAWARRRRALVVSSSGNFDDTTKALEQLRKVKSISEADRIANLRAQLAIYTSRNQASDHGDWLEALEEVHQLTDGVLTTRERQQLATLRDAGGDWKGAHTAYRDWLDAAPQHTGAMALFAGSLIAHHNEDPDPALLDEAERQLETLRRLEPDTYRTHALDARWLAASGEPEEAARGLSEFVNKFADVSLDPVFTRVAEASTAAEAFETLKSAERLLFDQTNAKTLKQADQLLTSGNDDDALAVLHRLANAQKTVIQLRTDALKNAADFLESIDQVASARDLYEKYATRSPRPVAPLEFARFLGLHGEAQRALELCSGHWDTNRPEHVAELAAAILRQSDAVDPSVVQEFLQRLEETIEDAPDDRSKRDRLFALASLQDLNGDYEAAAATFARIVQLYPNDLNAANNLTYLWARLDKNLPQALELIDHLIRTYGQAVELLDTKAVVLVASGQPRAAEELLAVIVKDSPDPVYLLHLAEAQAESGQPSAARETLKQAETSGLMESRLHRLDRAAYDDLRKSFSKRQIR